MNFHSHAKLSFSHFTASTKHLFIKQMFPFQYSRLKLCHLITDMWHFTIVSSLLSQTIYRCLAKQMLLNFHSNIKLSRKSKFIYDRVRSYLRFIQTYTISDILEIKNLITFLNFFNKKISRRFH